jgi:molybdopterin converting factor small subunit
MRIIVNFYAICRELTETPIKDIELPENADKDTLVKGLLQIYPQLKQVISGTAIAVNDEYVFTQFRLKEGDVISLIPPVSGG